MTEAKQPAADLDPALVKNVARAYCVTTGSKIVCPTLCVRCEYAARSIISSLGIPAAALNALAKGEAVVVPKEPTLEQVGRARDNAADCFGDIYREMLAASPYRSEP